MHGIIAKLLSPLWRTAEDEADAQSYVPAEKEIRHVSGGVVTCLCQDYGLIDDAVCFTSEEVLGGYPLHVGDAVRAIAVRGGSHDGWRAIRVERMTATWDDDVKGPKPESSGPKPLVGTITSCGQDGGFINQTTFFSRQALCQGFVPMKGDWVQAQYFINPRNWSSQASSVSPLRYRRMDHVRVSSMCGSRGTVEDSVFFTLDSLLLPDQYRPQPGDLVSVVVLESCQSLYSWRALNPVPDLIDMDLQALLENKGGLVVSYEAQCRALNLGRCTELLLLHFPKFTIGRCLEVAVRSEEEGLLQANAPYSVAAPLSKRQETRVVTVLPGPSPARLSKRHLPNFLANYPVPKALRDSVEAQRDVLLAQPQLTEPLSLSSMRPRFSALLWLEELEDEKELQELRLSCVFLRKGATYLHLEVPGLAEGRPRLIIGCATSCPFLYLQVYEEDVSLRVNSEFHSCYMGEPLDVEFTLNRLTMRRCHCALEQIRHFGENALFPTTLVLQAPQWSGKWGPDDGAGVDNMPDDSREEGTVRWQQRFGSIMNGSGKDADILSLCVNMVSVATQTKTGEGTLWRRAQRVLWPRFLWLMFHRNSAADESTRCKGVPAPGRFFNSLLNPAQREAVKRILAGECRPTPYILFGPPGTGKTITLVEAILQVYHRLPGSRVLVCTPSNSAADLICERLHDSGFLNAASLVRVNATCRPEESIPEVVRQYSQAGEDIRQALFHRIVVSTCSSAGMFYQIRICVGHFTHVFIDEAGQATEPEALIPLGLLSEKDGQIVLAGDPLQLGPVVKSRLAATYGLGMSLLERLMSRTLYSRGEQGYNPLLVTKLVYNYRSHEALLALPSRLFYAGELCVRAERAVVDCLCNWNRLPTKGFPVIFHGIRGVEMREGSSPSWFNPGEAVQVMLYCCQLAKRLYKPIAATDIGVITPYRKQVEKIRLLLHRVGLMDIRVGSVEEFQGQEALVVILSTVRSNEVAVNEDSQFVLGFLSNHRRFNVAVTRPKALLIVVGNPHVLVKDPCFSALLQYCYENGAFLGCDLPSSIRAARRFVFFSLSLCVCVCV
uniref:Helicase ATP-binding domain-containing protein n=1 Tax=Scleropages formosus TaxID=113540 RepID=A0A8C9VS08_SCLFO